MGRTSGSPFTSSSIVLSKCVDIDRHPFVYFIRKNVYIIMTIAITGKTVVLSKFRDPISDTWVPFFRL